MNLKKIYLIVFIMVFIITLLIGCGEGGGGNTTEYTLSITCDGSGRITDESGYAIVTRKYPAGTVVTLVPAGETGSWAFKSWSGLNGGEINNNQITINGDKNITAVFYHLTCNVTINVTGSGTVSQELVMAGSSLPTFKGDKIRLNPVPASGWYLDHWEGDLTSYESQPELVVDADKNITAVFKQAISYTDFIEGAESQNTLLKPQGTWEKTTGSSHSGSYSWTDTPNGNYSGTFNISLQSCAINMTGSQHPYLEFWHRYNTSYNTNCYIEVSNNSGETWTTVKTYSSGTSDWNCATVNLEGYKADTILIRFRINNTYSYSTGDGWYIDDVCIKDLPEVVYNAFNEGAESQTSLVFSDGGWGRTTGYYHSGSYSWTDSPSGTYSNYANTSLTSAIINLTGSSNPVLTFWQRYNVESGCDYCRVEISTDGGSNWAELTKYTGTSTSWGLEIINLNAYKTQTNVKIRFRFTSDGSVVYDGWYIDDISIRDPMSSYFDDVESGSTFMSSDGIWGQTTTYYHSASKCWTDSPSGYYSNNANASLTSSSINLAGSNNPLLYFWHRYSIDTSDSCHVEISTDGGSTWTELTNYTRTKTTWSSETISLSAYKSQTNLKIRFRLTSDSSWNYDGWYIDDIGIYDF